MYVLGIRIQKRFLSIPILIIILGVIYSLFFHKDESESNLKNQIKSTKAEFIINGFKLFESLQTGKNWNLKADVAEVFQDKNLTFLKKVFLTFYNQNGKIYKLTSDEAELNMTTKDVTLKKNVVLLTDDDYVIKSELVYYSPSTQILSGPGDVEVNGPKLTLTGKKFRGSLTNRNLSIFHNVITNVKDQNQGALIKKGKGDKKINLTVTSRSCLFEMLKNKATYTKNVHGVGSGFDIKSNKMIIEYFVKNNKREVKSIVSRGNVRILKDNKLSKSGRAFLDAKLQHLILTENPRVIEGNNVIKGEQIIYNYETGKMHVRKAKGIYKTE